MLLRPIIKIVRDAFAQTKVQTRLYAKKIALIFIQQ